jgi:integrase
MIQLLSAQFSDKIKPLQKGRGDLCMKGGIYTKERCPVCGGKFLRTDTDLICTTHLTRPRRVYIQLYSEELHKHFNVCSDSRGIAFSSYEQATRILTKIRAEIDAGDFDVTRYVAEKLKPLRFSNWVDNWLKTKEIEVEKGRLSPSYRKELRRFVNRFKLYFGEIDIRDIGTKRIDAFYQSIEGVPKTVRNIMSCLHKLFTDAKRWGDIIQIPQFPEFEVPEPDIKTIDLDEQDAVINSIPDLMDRAYILFTARQMVRPSETRALFWEDLDLKHDKVTIRRHFSLNELCVTTKSKRTKSLPLDAEVKRTLSELPRHITSPFVFHKNGQPYSESWARKVWKQFSLQMGIDISLYQGTRHSSATEAVNRVGMDRVQEFLGHTRSAMTRRYAKMNVNGLKPVLRKVEKD